MSFTSSTAQISRLEDSSDSYSVRKIALMGPFGGGNLGDAAIQESAIANFRNLNPDVEIYGFSLKPQDTKLRHGIVTYPLNRRANTQDYCWWQGSNTPFPSYLLGLLRRWQKGNYPPLLTKIASKGVSYLLELLAWLRAYQNFKQLNLDWLVVSGGGQLDDSWGGAWGHPFTLLGWGIIAKLNGSKFLIVSTGASPIEQPLSKVFTYLTLALADYRSYRDSASKKYIAEVVGFKANDPVYSDLAFSLPLTTEPKSTPPNPRVIGIAPMSYYHQVLWSEEDIQIYQQYLTKLADFASWLVGQNYTLVIFPGQIDHDQKAIADFTSLLQQRAIAEEKIILPEIRSVYDLMEQLPGMDLVIASRFHGVLLSLLAKKPVLALSYHPKIDALMTETELQQYYLEINNFKTDSLKNLFTEIKDNYPELIQQITQKTTAYQSALTKQYEYLFRNF